MSTERKINPTILSEVGRLFDELLKTNPEAGPEICTALLAFAAVSAIRENVFPPFFFAKATDAWNQTMSAFNASGQSPDFYSKYISGPPAAEEPKPTQKQPTQLH